jgi:hypothetical protein
MILRTDLSRTLYGVRVIRMSSARKDNMLLKTPFFLYIFTINAQLATPNANKIAAKQKKHFCGEILHFSGERLELI